MDGEGAKASMQRGWLVDLGVALWLLVVGVLFHLGRTGGLRPVTNLSGDAANIAGFAAARAHPERFREDYLLSDPKRFAFYGAVHVPMTQLLARHTGDFGTAFLLPLGLHVALQGFGFYLLGRALWNRRDWALVMACALLLPSGAAIGERFGEFWGVFVDPLPRVTFQALLPFVLALAVRTRDRTGAWPAVMVLAGLLMYVHPVSAPVWMVAIWAGLWSCAAQESRRARFLRMLALGLLSVGVALPVLVRYMANHEHGVRADAVQVREIMAYRFIAGFAEPGRTVCLELAGAVRRGVIPVALLASLVVLRIGSPEDRARLRLVLVWCAAVLLLCALSPMVDNAIARARGASPLQVDLVRGLRYLTPLCVILGLWPMVLADHGRPARRLACTLLAALVLFVGVRSKGGLFARFVLDELQALARGRIDTRVGEHEPARLMTLAVREKMGPGESVLVMSQQMSPLAIRYSALRSVAWSRKDGGALAYADHDRLKHWYVIARRVDAIGTLPAAERLRAQIALARELRARWVVADASPAQVTAVVGATHAASAGDLVLMDLAATLR